jgi:ATP-dependent Clp protease ATP-binding subunit ClpB
MDALRGHFRPEFLNRVDEVVIFEPLRRQDIAHIVEVQLARIQKLLADKRLTLELTPRARDFLAERGYDPTYGARPLKRVIQKHLVDRLALGLLQGDFAAGDAIVVDAAEGELTFERAASAAVPA